MQPLFPFTALVGLESLKLALQLAVIDPQLSVLAKGDKGAGKTTAVRALAALLPDAAPFVNLPIGATEDRVLGGLDLERALQGAPALKPGLLAAAHGGVLYIDEVNLLADHLADALLDAVVSGVHTVEREGFSIAQEARFVLVGSMNPEEGALRPQLLDRFALAVDVQVPVEPAPRREAVERRLAFDRQPAAFLQQWSESEARLAATLVRARAGVATIEWPPHLYAPLAEAVREAGVRSLRADLAVVRGARAMAALEGAIVVTLDHMQAVLPLVLDHRPPARTPAPPRSPRPDPPPEPNLPPGGEPQAGAVSSRVFDIARVDVPPVAISGGAVNGGASGSGTLPRGVVVGSRATLVPAELDPRASLVAALVHDGRAALSRTSLHERVRLPVAGTRFVFIVDSSGSQAVQQRMRLVKGTVAGILESSLGRHDEVAVVSFRGPHAEVALAPTTDADAARTALAYMATGGRTPLAHGLQLAATLLTDDSVVILLTDGRANVPTHSADAWADACEAAAQLRCPVVVVDSEAGEQRSGHARQLATLMGGTHLPLESITAPGLLQLLRPQPADGARR